MNAIDLFAGAGDYSTATAGYKGTAMAGYKGTAMAGDYGAATAGHRGTATAGYRGTATAGEKGKLCLHYWDKTAECYRTAIANIGKNGIKPNTAYKLDDNHQFVEAA